MKKSKFYSLFVITFFSVISSCGGGSSSSGTINETTLPEVTEFVVQAPIEGGKLVLTWKNPESVNISGVIIIRKTGSEPASMEDGEKIFQGDSTTYTDTELSNGTKYFYRIATTDGKGHLSGGITGYGIPLDKLPPSDVTNFRAISASDGSIELSWENSRDPDFDGVVIVKKQGSAPSSYSDGTRIYRGIDTSFVDTDTENGVDYFYLIASFDTSGNYSTGKVSNATSVDTVPPLPVSSATVTAIASGNALQITWILPRDPDIMGVKILRGENGYCPTSVTDTATGVMVVGNFPSNDSPTTIDTGLDDGTEYCYSIFSYDEVPNFSRPLHTEGTPEDTLPPAKVYGLEVTVIPEGNELKISWKEPSDSDYSGVKILKGEGFCPRYVTDSSAISMGDLSRGTAYLEDSGLTDDIEYCYSLFSYDEVPNYSQPATVTAIPHDSIPPAPVTKGKVLPALNGNMIMWEEPDDREDLEGYLIVAKEWQAPSGPTDGRVVSTSSAQQIGNNWLKIVDSQANKESKTYYAVYTYDEVPNYSTPWQGMGGLQLSHDANMGITGNLNQIVEWKENRWIVYSTPQMMNGLYVVPLDNTYDISTVASDPVPTFSAIATDKDLFIAYISLYRDPGIRLAIFDGSDITSRNTLVKYYDDTSLGLSAIAGVYDGAKEVHIFFAKQREVSGNPYYDFYEILVEADSGRLLRVNLLFTIPFSYDIDLFDIKAKWNTTLARAEMVLYFGDPDSGVGAIYWAYDDSGRWIYSAVEDPETNGETPVGFTGFNIDSKGFTYIFYKKNYDPQESTETRGVLKIYDREAPYTSMITFGTEYAVEGLYYNDSAIIFDEDDNWYILTYKNGINCLSGDIEEIFLKDSKPVTATIDTYPSSKPDDYPCLGRRQISGTIITNGTDQTLFVTAWNIGMKLYDGDPGDETATFNETMAGQDPTYHWYLLPLSPNGGIDLLDMDDGYYFLSSGFKDDEEQEIGILSPTSAANHIKILQAGNTTNYHVFDTVKTSDSIFVLARDGADLVILYSEDGGSTWSSHTVGNTLPKNGALKVLPDTTASGQFLFYVAYIDLANNLLYCSGQGSPPLLSFSCDTEDTNVETAQVDINIIRTSSSFVPFIQYAKYNGSSVDLKVWSEKGTSIVASGDIGGNRLYYMGGTLGSIFFNDDTLNIKEDITTNDPPLTMTPCTFSSDPRDPVVAIHPQITEDGKMVFYFGEPQKLYYGVYMEDQDCWIFNIPLALNATSLESYPRLDTLISDDEHHISFGYPSMPIFRNTGTNFVEEIYFTR